MSYVNTYFLLLIHLYDFRYIDGHHKKFEAAGVSPVPAPFYSELPCRKILDKSGHVKKKLQSLESQCLSQHGLSLENLRLSTPLLKRTTWKPIVQVIISLEKCLNTYSSFLWTQSLEMEALRKNGPQEQPEAVQLWIVEASESRTKRVLKPLYDAVDKKLREAELFSPINLCLLAPFDRRMRYRWIQNIQATVRIQLYKIKGCQATYAWRVPNKELDFSEKTVNIVKQIDQIAKQEYAATMKKAAETKFKNQATWTKDQALNLLDIACDTLDEDEFYSLRTSEKAEEIISSLEFGVPISDIITDQSERNGMEDKTKFTKFWEALQSLLDDHAAVSEERRQSTVSCISPLCVSLRDLIEQVKAKLRTTFPDDDVLIPSYEWIRLQFTPRNPRAKVAANFTSRFNVKFAIQKRLLRKSHPDQHYGAKVVCYFKEMVSM